MKWRLIAALAALLLAFVLLACDGGPDGSCRPPTPCGQYQGGNP